MKEYLDNEGVCFGVDCIRSYGEIRKLTQASIQACDQLLQVVKCRVEAEEAHASSLNNISIMPLQYSPGSLQDCMSQLQSDTRHKADQHQILAESLRKEVVQPITMLKDQLSKKEKSLFSQYTNMNSELKRLEGAFMKKSAKYTNAFQDSVANVSLCTKRGISNDDYSKIVAEAIKDEQANKTPSTPLSGLTSWNSLASLTSSTNLQATKEKGKDLLNWVVASASGTPTPNTNIGTSSTVLGKKELCLTTNRCLEELERARTSARKAWLDYIIISQRYAIKTQILLTKLQGMQESFILILQDHLRKIVVIESSFLANQQYDIQMLFKMMEDIDARSDMRQFILKNAAAPLDLYDSDIDEDVEDKFSNIDRDRSMSQGDNEEQEVDIIIDSVGRPSTTNKLRKEVMNKKNGHVDWSDSPWVSDIFSSFFSQTSSKLCHIKDLPLPPCERRLTFSRFAEREQRKDLSCDQPMQYFPLERVRKICKVSLLSRHIEKHNDLVGVGSLERLEIASVQKKRGGSERGRSHDRDNQHPQQNSVAPSIDDPNVLDMMQHPLTANFAANEMLKEDLSKNDDIVIQEEEEGEELMMYSTAEEALERMVLLQSRMRTHWLDLIEEFKMNDCSENKIVPGPSRSSEFGNGVEEEKVASLPESSNGSASPTMGTSSREQPQKDVAVDSSYDNSDMLNRSLKDVENDKRENVDSAKCREIMNSFGLLDAVIDDDHGGNMTQEMSPQSVQDLNVSTPLMRNKFDMSMPFLSSTKSDNSDYSDSLTPPSTANSNVQATIHTSDNPKTPIDEGFSKDLFGKVSPRSLDFLSS